MTALRQPLSLFRKFAQVIARPANSSQETPSRFPILIPAMLLLLVSVILRITSIDLVVADFFYTPDTLEAQGWLVGDAHFWKALYFFGVWPAILLAAAGCCVAVAGRREARNRGVFLLLVMLVGPLLVINFGFKRNWGRPRPREISQFGGQHEFTPVLSPGSATNTNSSFPSGHAAMGFYLMVPAFLFQHRRRLAYSIFAGGLVYGMVVGISRIAQGAHFLSDIVWSAGIVYIVAWALAEVILERTCAD